MSKVEKLMKRQAKELERAKFEDGILAELPEGCEPRHVHKSSLYGRVASVDFGDHYSRQVGRFGLAEALAISELLPANAGGMASFVNGSSFIVPAFHLDDTSTKVHRLEKDASSEAIRLDPVTVTLDGVGTDAEIKWHHRLPSGRVITVCVKLPGHLFGRRKVKFAMSHGQKYVKEDEFYPADLGAHVGILEKCFRSGSSEYPARRFIGFHSLEEDDNHYRADYVMTPQRLFGYLMTMNEVKATVSRLEASVKGG